MKRKRGRPPKLKPVVLPIVDPVEVPKIEETPEVRLYREVLLKTLVEDLRVPEEAANEIATKYKRISVLAKAIQEGINLPVSEEIYSKIKRLCLCR